MTQSIDPTKFQQFWQDTLEEMNEQFAEAVEQNLDAQSEFMNAWLSAFDATADEDRLADVMQGYQRAYETWMSAAEQTLDDLSTTATDDVPATKFRDTWLNAANESFKEIMATSAFAAATGQSIEEALNFRRQLDDITEDTLHDLGLPAKGDIREVGERLVELERRQHTVEQRLDQILDALDE